MKESEPPFVQTCLDILKREDIKKEISRIVRPILDFLFHSLKPYIYFIFFLVGLVFFMLFAILITLFHLFISILHLKKRIEE